MSLIRASTVVSDEANMDESNSSSLGPKKDLTNVMEEEAGDAEDGGDPTYSFWEKRSIAMSNRPWAHCCTSLILSLVLGVGGLIAGGFTVTVDGEGWESRGTLISDRQMQFMLIDYNADELYNDKSGDTWTSMINNKQENFYAGDDDGRRLERVAQLEASPRPYFDAGIDLGTYPTTNHERKLPFAWTEDLDRRLTAVNGTGIMETCDTGWYSSGAIFREERLWPVWRLKNMETASFLQTETLQELCEQEALTQKYLVENKLCFGCTAEDKCLQPYSLVLFARLIVDDGMNLGCPELAGAWGAYVNEIEDDLVQCVADLKADYNPDRDGLDYPASCPEGFSPVMIDELYDTSSRVQYSSSVFATSYDDIDALFEAVDNYARGEKHIQGAYDTQDEDFVNLALDAQLLTDMSLALASAVITTIAMVVHTKSLFLALTGLLQITLSFPLAYAVYKFIGGLDFFPFLNFIGVFVIFALGADDVFVAVDKWKNQRLLKRNATVQEIARVALPDAASAMLLTTVTTSVAFFGTAVCPVAPIRCFAIFVGLMVMLDYVLCCLLVFPALVIYDNHRPSRNCCCETTARNCCGCFGCFRKNDSSEDEAADDEQVEKQTTTQEEEHGIDADSNLIRRIFSRYYALLHMLRWPLLVLCGAGFILAAIRSASLDLPTSSDVRLYNEDDNQYEQNFVWRQHLLYDVLQKKGGSTAFVIWGVTPSDNGDLNNPDKWSSLVLDDSFEPSQEDVQIFLRDFCDGFFANEFAGLVTSDYTCPMNRFDEWLQEQSVSAAPDAIYQTNCGGASSVPMAATNFDDCMSAWADQEGETTVLSRQGKVEVMYLKFSSRVRYDSPYQDLDDEWHTIEAYLDGLDAPDGANNGYFTSEDFWWYDTNGQMLETAFASSGIALAAAAAAILISSRSIVLTIYSTVTVGYVLTSVTAVLVAMGWTLGFLEAILFAILIGISCDFVIHFSHAYAHASGNQPRGDRTLYALLSMGPSILAAAVTTFLAATLMLFTVIIFFQKFAMVLFMTVLQATIGSFVVFLTITDTIGPNHPTWMFDKLMAKCADWREARRAQN